jgi:itaconate CoA-transferase
VACDISGYGSSGGYRDKKAYDLLVQCEAGLLSITGSPDEPAKCGIAVADIAAGMYAFSGVLSALYERERTGTGTVFQVSLLDSLAEWMGYPYYYAAYGGAAPERTGARHASIAPYGPFRTGDGAQVFVAVQNDGEWVRLCEVVLDKPALATDPRFATNPARVQESASLTAEIEHAFAALTAEAVVNRLDRARIANARMRTLAEFAEHPQLRDRWREVDSPVGPLHGLMPPITVAGRRPRMEAVPAVGEHTEAVLAEIGER